MKLGQQGRHKKDSQYNQILFLSNKNRLKYLFFIKLTTLFNFVRVIQGLT